MAIVWISVFVDGRSIKDRANNFGAQGLMHMVPGELRTKVTETP